MKIKKPKIITEGAKDFLLSESGVNIFYSDSPRKDTFIDNGVKIPVVLRFKYIDNSTK